MRTLFTTALLAGLSLLWSCGSGRVVMQHNSAVSVTPLYGSSDSAVLSVANSTVSIVLPASADSAFAQIGLPDSPGLDNLVWSGLNAGAQATALAVALPNADGLEIGIVRIPGAPAQDVRLQFELSGAGRSVSVAPTGPDNIVTDLTVVDMGGGQVALGWTEINKGDLDLNGEVNAADLAPIAQNFNSSYNAADPFRRNFPAYWIDGDGNGVINGADLTPIGQHYKSAVAGYNVRRNGALIPGAAPGEPTILPGTAQKFPGLPRHYTLTTAGLPTDSWVVNAVDFSGTAGVNSAGNPGQTDLIANLTIGGVPLLDLNGSNPGGFGTDKFSSRIIDPIEIVANSPIANPAVQFDDAVVYTGLPRQKTLLVDFLYLPSVDLATGAPRGGSSVKRASVTQDEFVRTAVPINLPSLPGTAQIDANIDLQPNPAGGYFVELTATVSVPGQPTTTTTTRLDYGAAELNRDADDDGSFSDEATFADDDHDCVSNSLIENEINDHEYGDDQFEGEMLAKVQSVDQPQGTITFSLVTLRGGDLILPQPPVTMHFNEATEFAGLTIAELLPNTPVEVEFYQLSDMNGGVLPDVFWIESIFPEGTPFLIASNSRRGEIRVEWDEQASGFQEFILERYSPREPNGNYEKDWALPFPKTEDRYEDLDVIPGVTYIYKYRGSGSQDYLGDDEGVARPQD
jgi:hypothetical protein